MSWQLSAEMGPTPGSIALLLAWSNFKSDGDGEFGVVTRTWAEKLPKSLFTISN